MEIEVERCEIAGRRREGKGKEQSEKTHPSMATFFMMVSLPEEAAAATCCSMLLLIFALSSCGRSLALVLA